MSLEVKGPEPETEVPPRAPRVLTGWRARVSIAFGGMVVAMVGVLLMSGWSNGLRESMFEELRAQIADGSIVEWYAADSISKGTLDLHEASQAGPRGEFDTAEDGGYLPDMGMPLGGIIVWRSWGEPGWQVADGMGNGFGGEISQRGATPESDAMVRELRAKDVPMRPFEWGGNTTLEWMSVVGGLVLLLRLVMGPAPALGTRWFWFWVIVIPPVALGAIVYAVIELIGLRRDPAPGSDRRWRGLVGAAGAFVLSLVLAFGAGFLRSRGVPLPF